MNNFMNDWGTTQSFQTLQLLLEEMDSGRDRSRWNCMAGCFVRRNEKLEASQAGSWGGHTQNYFTKLDMKGIEFRSGRWYRKGCGFGYSAQRCSHICTNMTGSPSENGKYWDSFAQYSDLADYALYMDNAYGTTRKDEVKPFSPVTAAAEGDVERSRVRSIIL